MKVLVVGGTKFIGKHVVSALVAKNHDVTLLNRGLSEAKSLVPVIKADREADLTNVLDLKKNWDAVIDLSAYYPKDVASILEVLKHRTGRYILCSTISAYADLNSQENSNSVFKETDRLHTCSPLEAVDRTPMTYGQRKAECERLAIRQQTAGAPVVIIRPSIVYGAHDYTDRFAYWISRAAGDRKFILPESGATIIHRTYAPDLAKAFVAVLDAPNVLGRAYNIAEDETLSLRETLYSIGRHLGAQTANEALANAVERSADWLLKHQVKSGSDLPLWIPKSNLLINTERARSELAITNTPIHVAIAEATEAFLKEQRKPDIGLSPAREAELLFLPG